MRFFIIIIIFTASNFASFRANADIKRVFVDPDSRQLVFIRDEDPAWGLNSQHEILGAHFNQGSAKLFVKTKRPSPEQGGIWVLEKGKPARLLWNKFPPLVYDAVVFYEDQTGQQFIIATDNYVYLVSGDKPLRLGKFVNYRESEILRLLKRPGHYVIRIAVEYDPFQTYVMPKADGGTEAMPYYKVYLEDLFAGGEVKPRSAVSKTYEFSSTSNKPTTSIPLCQASYAIGSAQLPTAEFSLADLQAEGLIF